MKKIKGLLALSMMAILLCGCNVVNSEEKEIIETEQDMVQEMISETTELNDRQKVIMKKEGLSEDYNQLKDRQKEAAIKIEMLMNYLEDKYDKEFVYESYNDEYEGCLAARALDDGRCRVIQASLDWENDHYTYSDTYSMEVLAADDYETLFDEFMAENYPELDYFLDIYVSEMDGEKITSDNASVSLRIILKSCFNSTDEYKEFLLDVANWMQNSKFHNSIYCQVMDEDDFESANYFNYSRFMREEKYKYRFDADIDKNGNIAINELE